MRTRPTGEGLTVEQEELRGISRTVAEIEWLLLVLALLYLVFGGAEAEHHAAISAALMFYAAFILSFHYANTTRPNRGGRLPLKPG